MPFPAPVRGVRCSGDGPASAWALPGQPPRATRLHARLKQHLSAGRPDTRVRGGRASRLEPAVDARSGRRLRSRCCAWSAGRGPASGPGSAHAVAAARAATAGAAAASPAPRVRAAGAPEAPIRTALAAVAHLGVRRRRRRCDGVRRGVFRERLPILPSDEPCRSAPALRGVADRRPTAMSTATAPAAGAE